MRWIGSMDGIFILILDHITRMAAMFGIVCNTRVGLMRRLVSERRLRSI